MNFRPAKQYALRNNQDTGPNGRPCWIQKVPRAENLFIFSQAMNPEENDFPLVQSMLASVDDAGNIRQYGYKKVLGYVEQNEPTKRTKRHRIIWVDGTHVEWHAVK